MMKSWGERFTPAQDEAIDKMLEKLYEADKDAFAHTKPPKF